LDMVTKKLGAGMYSVDNKLEVDIPEMLAHFGYEDTEANRDLCVEIAEKAIRESGLVNKNATTQHTHHHRCLMCGRKFSHDGKRKKCRLPKDTFCQRCNS